MKKECIHARHNSFISNCSLPFPTSCPHLLQRLSYLILLSQNVICLFLTPCPHLLFRFFHITFCYLKLFSVFFLHLPSSPLQLLSYPILLLHLIFYISNCSLSFSYTLPSSLHPGSFISHSFISYCSLPFLTPCPHLSYSFFHISFFYLSMFSAFFLHLALIYPPASSFISHSLISICFKLFSLSSSFFHISPFFHILLYLIG